MSEEFDIAFVNCTNELEAFQKAKALCKAKMDHVKEILRDNLYYLAYQSEHNVPLDLPVKDLFWVRFLFWPEYNLLGLFKGFVRDYELEVFPYLIRFGDSSDQNYDYDYWPKEIPFFQKLKTQVQTMPFNEILKRDSSIDEFDSDDWVDKPSYEDYCRKSFLYKLIYHELDLHNVLYGKPCKPERFAMSAINTHEEVFIITTKAKAMIQKEYKG